MASQTERKWIVLLNKVPRGPLAEAEIRALLKEGIVRHNDIAFLVPPADADETEKRASQWKLLWQFPEFDRRLEEEANRTSDPKSASWAGTGTPAPPVAPVHPDRRHQMTPDEAEEKARETLPPELLDIAPEELVVHSTTQESFSKGDPVETPDQRSFDLNMPSRKLMGALAGIIILVFVVAKIRSGAFDTSTSPPPPFAKGPGAMDSKSNAVRMVPTARVTPRPSGTIVSAPSAPEARVPASRGRIEEPIGGERGEIEPPEDEDQLALEEGDEAPPATKLRRPAARARRPRVLSDDRAEPDENDDRDRERNLERSPRSPGDEDRGRDRDEE